MNSALVVWRADSEETRRLSIATRHQVFCDTGLQRCTVQSPGDPHDKYDRASTGYFGASYGGQMIGSARLIAGRSLSDLPTGRLLRRLPSVPLIEPGQRYSEASQFGFLWPDGIDPGVHEAARLRLTGEVVSASMEQGFERYLLTLRGVMFGMLSWVPWNMVPPFHYPPEEGGPLVRPDSWPEPMWPVTVNLHELAASTMWLKPAQYELMFPTPPAWLDLSQVRPRAEMIAVAQHNRLLVTHGVRDARRGAPLPKLAPRVA